MAVIELSLANAGYDGSNVLHDINLEIDAGEKVALVGKSGAGKSTLLRLIYERMEAEAALVPQDLGLVRALSVFHNVYIGQLNRHSVWHNLANLIRPMRRDVEAVQPIVEKLGLGAELFSPVGALSGGQQQRTAVCRALYQHGDVLLADEPVSAVDEHQSRVVLESINAAKNTVVLAMHDVELALEYTDRVVGLRDGHIVMSQPTATMTKSDLVSLYTG